MKRWIASFLLISFSAAISLPAYGQIGSFGSARGAPPSRRGFSFGNQLNLNEGQKKGESRSETGLAAGSGGRTSTTDYQVHVLGQVRAAGTYRVGPSVRAAEAIAMAGGADTLGSNRRVELRRHNKVTYLDISKFIQDGHLNENPFLQDNDVIFIPFADKHVRIEGPVKNGGTFELAGETNVWQVVQLAGGYTVGASQKDDVVIVRYSGNGEKNLVKAPNLMSELQATEVQNGDVIVIPHILTSGRKFDYNITELPKDEVFYPSLNDNVFVVGAVSQAGPIAFNTHFKINDYVNVAGPTQIADVRRPRIVKSSGEVIRHAPRDYALSPGDTIFVPEKQVTVAKVATALSLITSPLITYISIRALIKDL